MGKGYRHLSLEERDTISEMKRNGHRLDEIAVALRRSKSTISREVNYHGLTSVAFCERIQASLVPSLLVPDI